jgi:MFS family permease
MISFQNKIRKFIFKFKDKNFLKGISTLIGASCINFLVGAIFSLCTLSVYEISYIKGKGGSIEIEHLTFYYPVEIFFQCISAFISGIIYKKYGLHKTNLIGVTILSLGYYLMYLSTNLNMDLLAMILGGIGTGIIFYPSTTNAYEWFKDHNGIIVGIMETMISFGSFFFALIGEKIINKNEIPSHDDDNLYDFDIGKRIKIYLIIQIITLNSAFILSFILMYEKKNINNSKDEKIPSYINDSELMSLENKNEDNDKDDSNEELEMKDNSEINIMPETNKYLEKKENIKENIPIKNNINDKLVKYVLKKHKLNKNNNNKKNKKDFKKMLKLALKSSRLILFSAIVILQAPVANMAFSLYREIGEYEKIDIKYLQLIGSLYFIFECLSSFVFGLLCDYIQLKYLLFFINGVGTFVGFTYCFTFKNSLIFFLVQNFLSFSAGGYYPVKDCFLMKVFGKDIYIELSGYVSFLVALSVNILTPITYFFLSGLEKKELAYWILFVSFGTMNLIGLILNFFLKESPIDLEKMIKVDKKRININQFEIL